MTNVIRSKVTASHLKDFDESDKIVKLDYSKQEGQEDEVIVTTRQGSAPAVLPSAKTFQVSKDIEYKAGKFISKRDSIKTALELLGNRLMQIDGGVESSRYPIITQIPHNETTGQISEALRMKLRYSDIAAKIPNSGDAYGYSFSAEVRNSTNWYGITPTVYVTVVFERYINGADDYIFVDYIGFNPYGECSGLYVRQEARNIQTSNGGPIVDIIDIDNVLPQYVTNRNYVDDSTYEFAIYVSMYSDTDGYTRLLNESDLGIVEFNEDYISGNEAAGVIYKSVSYRGVEVQAYDTGEAEQFALGTLNMRSKKITHTLPGESDNEVLVYGQDLPVDPSVTLTETATNVDDAIEELAGATRDLQDATSSAYLVLEADPNQAVGDGLGGFTNLTFSTVYKSDDTILDSDDTNNWILFKQTGDHRFVTTAFVSNTHNSQTRYLNFITRDKDNPTTEYYSRLVPVQGGGGNSTTFIEFTVDQVPATAEIVMRAFTDQDMTIPTDDLDIVSLNTTLRKLSSASGGTSETSVIYDDTHNSTGSALPAGSPVQLSAIVNGELDFGYAQANSKATCTSVVLIMSDAGIDGTVRSIQAGDISCDGDLTALMTDGSSPTKGSVLYVASDNPSKYTTVEPVFPNYSCRVGKLIDVDYTPGSESFRIAIAIDVDPTFAGDIAVQSGSSTMPLVLADENISLNTGSTSTEFYSTLIIPDAPIRVSNIACNITQLASIPGGIKMAIYSPGGAQDTLIAETQHIPEGSVQLGINVANLSGGAITLSPNTRYMIALLARGNATQFSKKTTYTMAPPNHSGRSDTNLTSRSPEDPAPATISASQSSTCIWFGLA